MYKFSIKIKRKHIVYAIKKLKHVLPLKNGWQQFLYVTVLRWDFDYKICALFTVFFSRLVWIRDNLISNKSINSE